MLSEFGKFTRKLRIDNSKLLKDMAEELNVTTSYLSAVEMGKRNVPEGWKKIIADNYHLNEVQIEEMDKAIYNSQKTIKVNLNNYSNSDRDLILAFARKFDELENDEKEIMKNILER